MGILNAIFGDSKEQKLDQTTLVEANVCPNCWGKQSFDDKFKDYVVDQTKSNINHDKLNKKAFVQQFVEKHVTGIKLKKDEEAPTCPACKSKFYPA